jgi:hypothetical protein
MTRKIFLVVAGGLIGVQAVISLVAAVAVIMILITVGFNKVGLAVVPGAIFGVWLALLPALLYSLLAVKLLLGLKRPRVFGAVLAAVIVEVGFVVARNLLIGPSMADVFSLAILLPLFGALFTEGLRSKYAIPSRKAEPRLADMRQVQLNRVPRRPYSDVS